MVLAECMAQIGYPHAEKGTSEDSKYSQIFRLKALHLLAFFILVYVGVEVTIGGLFLAPRANISVVPDCDGTS